MKLNQPKTSLGTYRRELPPDCDYLAGGATAYIEAKCNPGGHLNAGLMAANDQIDLTRRVASLEASEKKDKADYAKAIDKAAREAGEARFAAIYEHCVVSWETNIHDDGKPMECNRANFLALAGVRHPAIVGAMTGFAQYVEDIGRFVREADGDAEKN